MLPHLELIKLGHVVTPIGSMHGYKAIADQFKVSYVKPQRDGWIIIIILFRGHFDHFVPN